MEYFGANDSQAHARAKSGDPNATTDFLARKYANKMHNPRKQRSNDELQYRKDLNMPTLSNSAPSSFRSVPNATSELFSQATEHESEAERRILQALDRVRNQRRQKETEVNRYDPQHGQEPQHPLGGGFPNSLPPGIETAQPASSAQLQTETFPDYPTETGDHPTNDGYDAESQQTQERRYPPNQSSFAQRVRDSMPAPSSSSLAQSTRYLTALHQHNEEPEEEDELEELKRQEKLKAADSVVNGTGAAGDAFATMTGLDRLTNATSVLLRAKNAFRANVKNGSDMSASPNRILSTNSGFPSSQSGKNLPQAPSSRQQQQDAGTLEQTTQDLSPKAEGNVSSMPGSLTDTPASMTTAGGGGGNENNPNASSGEMSLSAGDSGMRIHRPFQNKKKRTKTQKAVDAVTRQFDNLNDLFNPKRTHAMLEFLQVFCCVIVPSLIAAVVLFYFFDNPPTGRCKDALCGLDSNGNRVASASWWVLFMGVRQVLTWLLARILEYIGIDTLLMQVPIICRMFGPRLTLLLLQSKGWPSITFWWFLLDAAVLYGEGAFPQHWLYFQDEIAIFSNENPSGEILTNSWYRTVLIAGIVLSVLVTLKRHFVGLHLGKRLYVRYHERLDDAMHKIALLSELAIWVRKKHDRGQTFAEFEAGTLEGPSQHRKSRNGSQPRKSAFGRKSRNSSSGSAPQSQIEHSSDQAQATVYEPIDYVKILDPWVEPKRAGNEVSGHQIVEFRQAFAVMVKPFFLTRSFGPVETREDCIRSADKFFGLLLNIMEGEYPEAKSVHLESMTRWMFNGFRTEKEHERAEDLIDLLGPDIDGRIAKLEFVKAVDIVYKEVRLLENAVLNASHIDREYEKVLNFTFYFAVVIVAYGALGLDISAMFVALSSFVLGFAFMIGPASAQVFEGVMLVLGRQPYDVGDRVAFANNEEAPSLSGSSHWMVEKVDLLSTTARLTATSEVATFSNGSIARSRIINMNRSPDPFIYVRVRFETNVSYSTILVFKSAVEKFIDERPQDWQAMVAFRTSRVEPENNFVEYEVVLQHRLTWQSLAIVLAQKAEVQHFCTELLKLMGCRYKAPPKPVKLRIKHNAPEPPVGSDVELEQEQSDGPMTGGLLPGDQLYPNNETQVLEIARKFESGRTWKTTN